MVDDHLQWRTRPRRPPPPRAGRYRQPIRSDTTARRRCLLRLILAALAAVGLGACQAATTVAVTVAPDGSGAVVVTVVVDRAAQAEIGGLAAQLRTADVAAAGWSVAGPRALPGGGSEVAATHPFTDGAQLSALLAEVIAPTRIHGRAVVPLTLTVSTHRSFWRTTRRVSGAVDLRCGLGCFGDAALRRAFGSVVGVDPAPLGGRAAATRALPFTLRVAIGGRVTSAPGATGAPGRLTWSASLGQRIPIDATVVTEDTAHVRDARIAAAVGGAVVVALVAVGVVVAVRRRRSRHRLRHAAGP